MSHHLRLRGSLLVVLVMLLLVVVALPFGVVPGASPAAADDPVRVMSSAAPSWPEGVAFIAELEAWASGSVAIDYEQYGWVDELTAELLGADPPDVVITWWPGVLAELGSDGALVDLADWVPQSSMEDAFGEHLVDAAGVDGQVFGLPIKTGLASLVWYLPATFAAQGYSIPTTFAELVALSDEMVADGFTPWCNYMENGDVGTDWVEELVLSAEGATVYDQWANHDIFFEDTRVATAFERFLSMIDTPGYVFDRANILNISKFGNTLPLANGDCLMTNQKDGFRQWGGYEPASMSSFPFPPVSSTHEDTTLGSGYYIAAVSSRSEVRDLIEHVVSDQWGTAALADAGFGVPNAQFDTSQYSDMQARSWADETHTAIKADMFRFDGSDLMPSEVGLDSFFQGIEDLVSGAKPLSQVLQDIDASWPVDSFTDDDESVFEADIEWLAAEGITRGCNPPVNDRFCPDQSVTRGQMAAFLTRALELPAAPSAGFVDTVGSTFENDIDRLAAAGITRGCNPPANDRFCPDDPVRREVMAAFLVRALGYTDDGGGDLFTDDDGSIFEADIDKLATAGVTRGCNPPTNDRFCPTSNVTRGQMAAFLHRALG